MGVWDEEALYASRYLNSALLRTCEGSAHHLKETEESLNRAITAPYAGPARAARTMASVAA